MGGRHSRQEDEEAEVSVPQDASASEQKLQSMTNVFAHLLNGLATGEDLATNAMALDMCQILQADQFNDTAVLEKLIETLCSCKSRTNRVLAAWVLSRQVARLPAQNPRELERLELPNALAYVVQPNLHVKDQIAEKMLLLLAHCHHQRAETRTVRQAIDHLTRVDDERVLGEVLLGLDTWPFRGVSLGWSRLLEAERHLSVALPDKAPSQLGVSHEVLKQRICLWLTQNGNGGNAEHSLQRGCLCMLETRSFDDRCLANLQWGLSRWQFASTSLVCTRLIEAKHFLTWHSA